MQISNNMARFQKPVQFQGNGKGWSAVLLGSALALAGCDIPSRQAIPPSNVTASSDWVDLGKSNSVKPVMVDGKKFLLVDGFDSVALIPFQNSTSEQSGVKQETDWVDQGKSTALKTITVDGERFVIADGFDSVAGQNLGPVQKEAQAK